MNHAAHNWINTWLETQRDWLSRWQAMTEQRDPVGHSMEALRAQLNAASMPPQALNLVQTFQSLLQSCMGGAEGESSHPWQQLLQALPLGPAREQQLLWNAYQQALAEHQRRMQAVLNAYAQVFNQALEAVPVQAAARAHQGQPVNGLRELYELWIECGEKAFAPLAREPQFIAAQAASGNALSQLKVAQQALLEQWLKQHDLPTRSELNSVHQRLRDMTARMAVLEQQRSAKPRTQSKARPRRKAQEPDA